ncbi:MAG: N-acetylmuramoyl-L-alanine amidase [Anaerohalosphaera sp.]|nr:N-acetylmuramoyl-L-alanine amidase [Anaerohalosphaera sp.]
MEKRARTAKVLVSLVASMTIGAFVLMALDKQAISAGAFSLASYTTLNPVDQAANPVETALTSWDSVEIYCDRNNSSDSHFAVLNNFGKDGTIRSTTNWKKQKTCLTLSDINNASKTIRVCIVTSTGSQPTDSQIKRAAALVENLSRKCDISPNQIKYPENWRI